MLNWAFLFVMKHLAFALLLALISGTFGCTQTGDTEVPTTQSKDTTVQPVDRYSAISNQIKKTPNNPELYYNRSKVLFDSLSLEDAMADVERALKLDTVNTDFLLHQSDIYYRMNKTGMSRDVLAKILELDKDHLVANLKLAEIYHIVGNFEKSIEYVNEVLRIDVYNATAYYWKGLNYKLIGDTATAVSSFQTAREQDNDFYQAFIQLGLIYGAVHDNQAISYYDNAIRIDPASFEAHYNKAIYLQENDFAEQALLEYQTLIKIGVRLPQVYHNIGYVNLIHLKDYPAALDAFNLSLSLFPEYLEAMHNRGLTHEAMGNAKAAEADYRQVLAIEPGYTKSALGLERLLD